MKVLLTGSSGVVGREMAARLSAQAGYDVVGLARHVPDRVDAALSRHLALDLVTATHAQIASACRGFDAVVHLAAQTPSRQASRSSYFEANAEAARKLLAGATVANVGKFVHLSSAAVHGSGGGSRPFDENSPLAPDDDYALSKAQAESLVMDSKVDWTILRPPVVYGPAAKGSLRLLMKAVATGLPLPLGGLTGNRRDLIGVTNLVAVIERCLTAPEASRQIFLVSDREPISTRGLVETMADALGRKPWLVNVRPGVLLSLAGLIGKGNMMERLAADFMIDDRKARERLGWQPARSRTADMKRMAEHLLG